MQSDREYPDEANGITHVSVTGGNSNETSKIRLYLSDTPLYVKG